MINPSAALRQIKGKPSTGTRIDRNSLSRYATCVGSAASNSSFQMPMNTLTDTVDRKIQATINYDAEFLLEAKIAAKCLTTAQITASLLGR